VSGIKHRGAYQKQYSQANFFHCYCKDTKKIRTMELFKQSAQ